MSYYRVGMAEPSEFCSSRLKFVGQLITYRSSLHAGALPRAKLATPSTTRRLALAALVRVAMVSGKLEAEVAECWLLWCLMDAAAGCRGGDCGRALMSAAGAV